jgi:Sec-independent protein translocase protein TatA
MDILGIGPLELLFIVIIALIVLGPKDMAKAGRSIGRFLRTMMMSETWQVVRQASSEIRGLPNRLMREAGVEDLKDGVPNMNSLKKDLGLQDIQQDLNDSVGDLSDWTTPPPTIAPPKVNDSQVDAQAEEAPGTSPNDIQQSLERDDSTEQEVSTASDESGQDSVDSVAPAQDAASNPVEPDED